MGEHKLPRKEPVGYPKRITADERAVINSFVSALTTCAAQHIRSNTAAEVVIASAATGSLEAILRIIAANTTMAPEAVEEWLVGMVRFEMRRFAEWRTSGEAARLEAYRGRGGKPS